MGARPLFGLNIVAWSRDELPLEMLEEVLAGAAEAARDDGFVLAGGHTIDDPSPKFGVAVIGEADPGRLITTAGLRDGDILVLSDPIGIGVITTAIKAGAASQDAIDAAVATMVRSNASAAAVALDAGVTGGTDVTGFGLLGHLANLLDASGMDAEITVADVPLLPDVARLAAAGNVPGGTRRNLAWVAPRLTDHDVDEALVVLLADAQTSGGLLIGVDPGRSESAVERLRAAGHPAAVIGRVTAGHGRIGLG
jgi:selenide, water dikinase